MRLKLKSRVFTAAIAVALVGGALAATGVATATTPSTTYYACLRTVGGTLYNVNSTRAPKCTGKDLAISWSQKGPAGANGTNGKTILNGTTTPTSTIGNNGDFYLDTAIHTLYGPKADGAWPTAGTSLVGPQGPKGATGATGATGAKGATGAHGAIGAQGPAGTNGRSVSTGTKAPLNIGACPIHNTYIDITNGEVYSCSKGKWVDTGKSIMGPAGANGTSVVTGTKAPAVFHGRSLCITSGDTYIDITTGEVYSCSSAFEWVDTGKSIMGPAGSPPQPDLSRVATLEWWGGAYSGGSYGFADPRAIAFDGTHIWVANLAGNSVTELKASDGDWVRTLSGGSYGFSNPEGVAFDGTHIWVANWDNSVTELDASDGDWVQTLSGGSYGFSEPSAIAFDGTHIWVANEDGNSVTEINASDGSWVNTFSGGYGFSAPDAIAFGGTHIWVANWDDSVTELDASDGDWVQTLSGGSYGFDYPIAIAFDGTHIWVANMYNSVTELNASDGSWVQTVSNASNASYGFHYLLAIAFDGTHIWVANYMGNSVTELDASNGDWVQTLSSGSYGFNGPGAIAFDGTHIWVANEDGNSVTDVPAG
jgi:hypothetical protein